MPKPIIQLKKVSVIYEQGKPNEVKALDEVDLEIFEGEFVAVFGPSGCGKSTLLYAVAGIERPTQGSVFVFEKELSKMSSRDLAAFRRDKIGFIFQAFHLIPTLDVLTNVVLPQIFSGQSPKKRNERALGLLERFGVAGQIKKVPSGLSGGQQQRVAIARALINDPQLILADEPIGNLDSASAEVIMNILADLSRKEGRSVVLVTHDPRYLVYCHRVFWMKDGKIVRTVEQRPTMPRAVARSMVEEKILQRFPWITSLPLKAKALTDHFWGGYDIDIQRRIEHELQNLIAGRISYDQFETFLDRPFKDGGAGLYRPAAKRFGQRLRQILEAAERLARIRRVAQDIPVLLRNELNSILGTTVAEGVKLSPAQRERILSKASDRVLGKVEADEFFGFLDRAFDEGGAGLDERVARRIFWEVELLLVEYASS